MRSKRPLSINNCLVHGICNYNCKLCSVNKPTYKGPKNYQTLEATQMLVERIEEAAKQGIYIRHCGHSGAGEPTLHPGFSKHIGLFGKMIEQWSYSIPPPNISLVTNAFLLHRNDIMQTIIDNSIIPTISLPTINPKEYGELMVGNAEKGDALLESVFEGVEKCFKEQGAGRLKDLYFHCSPPQRDIVRNGISAMLDHLTKTAKKHRVGKIKVIIFPATSNRSGAIKKQYKTIDMFKDIYKKYNKKKINTVQVELMYSYKMFYKSIMEIVDVFRSFKYPCLWNASFFISSSGASLCVNDQAHSYDFGDIFSHSFKELMERKESYEPDFLCKPCNQKPTDLKGSLLLSLLRLIFRVKKYSID